MMQKKYSVLMSVYKNENSEYFRQAIESMVSQTVEPDEFVIVKDGPLTDELNCVIEEYKNRYENLFNIVELEKNQGLGRALAFGIENCKNEYIARMDSDDIAAPNRAEKELKILNENPEVDVIGSIVADFEDDIKDIMCYHLFPEKHSEIYKFAKKRNPCNHSSIMMKKSKILEVGNYKEYLYFEDYDLWIRMLMAGHKFYNIQEPLIYMRTEEGFFNRRGRI